MLKQLVDAIRPGVSRLEAQLTEAEADLRAKRLTLNTLLLESGADGPAAAKAADAVDSAERRVKHLQGALGAAREHQRTLGAQTDQDARRVAWQVAVQLAEKRHAAAQKLLSSMSQFAADYRATLQANDDLVAALPANPDRDANMTDRFNLETSLRKELVRLGVQFAFAWPYGSTSIPPVLPQLEGALEVVRRAVPQDLR